jgi:hypothetical protein
MKSLFIILISSFPLLINAQSNFKTLYQNDQLNSYPELTRGEKEKFESSNRLNSNQTFNLKSMTSLHLKHKDIKVKSWSKEGLPEFISFGKKTNFKSNQQTNH